jgi:hypothetical protein
MYYTSRHGFFFKDKQEQTRIEMPVSKSILTTKKLKSSTQLDSDHVVAEQIDVLHKKRANGAIWFFQLLHENSVFLSQ